MKKNIGQSKTDGPDLSFSLRPRLLVLLGLIYNITSVLKSFFHGSQACFFVSCCWEFFFPISLLSLWPLPLSSLRKNQSSSEFCSQFFFSFIQISVTKNGTFTIQNTKHLDLVHKWLQSERCNPDCQMRGCHGYGNYELVSYLLRIPWHALHLSLLKLLSTKTNYNRMFILRDLKNITC